ncbi:TPM domain-containing protein [Novosphingopyxis iocasae]|uniref:TPM domain-containing protein n=1 Tax=Novosphingopyxis iocasae TaxID=2762729 RepID=UPI0016517148|nr:TPM domain-containing protein [Novosphingopyxis iocasae]
MGEANSNPSPRVGEGHLFAAAQGLAARFLLLFALFFAALTPAAAQDFPKLTGRVVDQAGILDDADEVSLTQQLAALELRTGRQVVVATVPSLQGYPIEDFGYQLGRTWGIGSKENNDGVLLLVAPEERQVSIEVGYGLEPVLTDTLASTIVQGVIIPRFRDGDYSGGIQAGVKAIASQLELPPEEARKRVAAADAQARKRQEGGFPWAGLIWLGFFAFMFIGPLIAGGRGRRSRYRRGAGMSDVILWGILSGMGDSGRHGGGGFGGGGFGGGGGLGGGGFSGGGGSFGGGGASGGW